MSGHSHWHSIKYQKSAADAKRSKAFSKMARLIAVAAKEGGNDPAANPKLKLAIEQAKALNLPKENIERAIKRGTGELTGDKLEEFVFEAYGPGGTAIIINGITDNKNRSLGEIKQILAQHQGKLVGEGAVRWMFERKGTIEVRSLKDEKTEKEELELKAIDAGAEDVYWHNNLLDIYTKPGNLEKVKKNLEERGIKIESASLDWVAKETVELEKKDKEACQKLFEALDENDAVQDIYSNLKL